MYQDVELKYGKDVAELIKKIDDLLTARFESHSFGGQYAEDYKFSMTNIPDVGVFLVKFKDAPFVAITGINMISGDYYFESTEFGDQKLVVYDMDGLDASRLVSRAEDEWSLENEIG